MYLCRCWWVRGRGTVCYPLKRSIRQKLKDWKPGCSTIKRIYSTQCLHISEQSGKKNQGTEHNASHCHPVLQQSRSTLYSTEAKMLKTSIWVILGRFVNLKTAVCWKVKSGGTVGWGHDFSLWPLPTFFKLPEFTQSTDGPNNSCHLENMFACRNSRVRTQRSPNS